MWLESHVSTIPPPLPLPSNSSSSSIGLWVRMKGSYVQHFHSALLPLPPPSAEYVCSIAISTSPPRACTRAQLNVGSAAAPAECWGQVGEMLMRAVCTPVHRLASSSLLPRHSNKVIVSEDFSSCYLFALLSSNRKPTRYCPNCWNSGFHNITIVCAKFEQGRKGAESVLQSEKYAILD